MPNRFRDPYMREQYDVAVWHYQNRHRNLFAPDGQPRIGSSFAEFFWRGFNGIKPGAGFTDRASRSMVGYAYYRAGQDCAKRGRAA